MEDDVQRYRKRRELRLKSKRPEDSVEKYRERRYNRLRSKYDEEDEESGGHGNTRIPFGLCKHEGISVGSDWTPRDAWEALAGKGYSASEVYRKLKETGQLARRLRNISQKVAMALRPKKNEAVFFSGCMQRDENGNIVRGSASIANEWARNNKGVTMGTLLSEHDADIPEWDFSDPDSVSSWEEASRTYAEQASGDVRVIARSPLRKGSIFESVELPTLKKNKNVTSITMINPDTGEKTIIFRR